jgi:VWFA-related protein
MKSRIALALVAATASAQLLFGGQSQEGVPPQSQASPPVFRSRVESVRLDAVVTDRNGNPVTDLVAEDFEVRESGKVQTIQQFSRVMLPEPRGGRSRPTSTRAAGPVPDVTTNDQNQERIYVIVLGPSSWQGAMQAGRIAQRFLDGYFDDGDLAAVVTLDRAGPMHFTNDRAALMKEADAFLARTAAANAWGYPGGFTPRSAGSLGSFGGGFFAGHQDRRAEIFGEIARALGHIEVRRKSILYIGGGLSFDPYDAIDMPRSSFSEGARVAMDPIMAGNLSVYPIPTGGVIGPLNNRNMRALAYVTGGVPSGTDFDRAFRQIVRDNSMYYVLGYDSANLRQDGGYRRIQVRVNRPGVKVRARDGYFVDFPEDPNPDRLFSWNGRASAPRTGTTRPDLSPAMTKAMSSPVALTSVPIKVFAAPYRGDSREGSVTVVVEIAASGLDLARNGESLSGKVDVAIGSTTGTRSLRGTEYSYDVTAQGETRERLERSGLRVTSELRLSPGQHRLHVAAGARGGRIGKVLYDITVPDFTRGALLLSGVTLTSAAAADAPTLQSKKVRPTGLPGPPTVAREFGREETVALYAELYENLGWAESDHAISLTTELRGENGRVVPMTSESRSSRAPQLAGGGHGFVAVLPLSEVPPGDYVVRVDAHSNFEPGRTVTREIPIKVRQ